MQLRILQMGIPRTLAKREMLERNCRSQMDEERLYNIIYNMYEDDNKATKAVADFLIHKSKRES